MIAETYGEIEFPSIVTDGQEIESHNVPLASTQGGFPQYPIVLTRDIFDFSKYLILLREETEYNITIERIGVESNEIRDFRSLNEFSKSEDWLLKKSPLHDSPQATDYILNFRSYVGRSVFDFSFGVDQSQQQPFLVRSKKIDYLDDFGRMLSEISEFSSGLLLDPSSPLSHYSSFTERPRQCLYQDYLFLEYLMKEENIPTSLSRISKIPHTRIVSRNEQKPLALCNEPQIDSFCDLTFSRNEIVKNAIGELEINSFIGMIETAIDSALHESMDNPENRVVKFFLEGSLGICLDLQELWGEKNHGILGRLEEIEEELISILNEEWLAEVGVLTSMPSNSQVMQRKAGYRRIGELLRMMDFTTKFEWEEFNDVIDSHSLRLSTLYEIWCYISMIRALESLSGVCVKMDDVFERTEGDWRIRLRRDSSSRIRFFPMINGRRIQLDLLMNSKFKRIGPKYHSYSFQHTPDFSIVVSIVGCEPDDYALIHFDAKYRTRIEEQDNPENEDDSDTLASKFPWVSDINKMHTYKDAILRTQGAYTLFPGNHKRIYVENITEGYEKAPIPSVGAICLSPSSNRDRKNLENWIVRLLEKLVNASDAP
jgi:predicted component of viral defense system (DUF524 family)